MRSATSWQMANPTPILHRPRRGRARTDRRGPLAQWTCSRRRRQGHWGCQIDPGKLGGGTAEAASNTSPTTTVKEYIFVPASACRPSRASPPTSRWRTTRPLRPQRLGRLGADHPGQRRLQGRQSLEDARRQGVQGRAGADRQPGGDARRLRRRRRPHRLGARSTWCRCSWRASSTSRASRATAASCRASISRSTGPTAATASSSARTSRPSPTCAARSWCWPQNSPSHYFALNMLVAGGVQPSEVKMVFTDDAFQAAAAFNAQKDIAGCVSWAPDIYNLEKVRGNRMLVTTAHGQQADRRRLVRPRRLRQGPSRHHRGPGPRHLRRHGRAEGRGQRKKRRRADGRGLQHSRRRRPRACSATPTAPTGPRTTSSS